MKLDSTAGWLVAGTYLVVVLAAVGYLAYRHIFAPAGAEFAGMPALMLTMPWSMVIGGILADFLGSSMVGGLFGVAFGAAVNMALLYGAAVLVARVIADPGQLERDG